MEQKLFLSLISRSTSTKKPIYKIIVNGHVLEFSDSDHSVKTLDQWHERHDFVILRPQIQVVDIALCNKTMHDTKLRSDGQIVEDLLLIIEKFQIGHIDLSNKIDKISVYRGEQGQIYRTFNHITFNGVYRIKIHRNPLYTEWLASYR